MDTASLSGRCLGHVPAAFAACPQGVLVARTTFAWFTLVLTAVVMVTACEDETTSTSSFAGASDTAGTSETPTGNASEATPTASEDDFCEAVIAAITTFDTAADTYINQALAAVAAAGLSNDLSGINALGPTLNDAAITSREHMYDAHEATSDPAARDGIAGMITYLDSYLIPSAVVMTGASDFDQLSADLSALTQANLSVIEAQSGHATAVIEHTELRCDTEIDSIFAP